MALPKVPTSIYTVSVVGYEKPFKYRAFNVGEYKAFLQAKQFGDDFGFVNTIKDIVSDCLFNEINVDELPMYVLNYLFLIINSKSKGEDIPVEYKCSHRVYDKVKGVDAVCNAVFPVDIRISDAYIKYPENFNQKCVIKLSDTVGLKLKSPSFSKFRSVSVADKGIIDLTDEFLYACVDCVFDGDKILVPGKDFNFIELKEFIEQFPTTKINEIVEFFNNQPDIYLEMNLTCPRCKNSSLVVLKGINDFLI